MEKQCEECGCSFTVDEAKRNWQRVKFCSVSCQKKKSNKDKSAKYVPQTWPQTRNCVRCGSEFSVDRGGSRQEYCSKPCYREGRNLDRLAEVEKRRQAKICPGCKTSFIPGRRHPNKQIYCSMKCYYRATRMNSVSAIHRLANQTEWQRSRKIVIERDGNKCKLCSHVGRTEVHHLDFSGGNENGNNHPDNLMTLCIPCHKAIHHVELVLQDGQWIVRGKIFNILGLEPETIINPLVAGDCC